MRVDRYKNHDIEVVVDRLTAREKERARMKKSLSAAMKQGKGVCMILEKDGTEPRYFSSQLMCPTSGISYNEPAPHSFSFNSPQGACPHCNGLGTINDVDLSKIIPDDSRSIRSGALIPVGPYRNTLIFWQLEAIATRYKFTLDSPFHEIPEQAVHCILHGSDEPLKLQNTPLGATSNYFLSFEGIINHVQNGAQEGRGGDKKQQIQQYIRKISCPHCNGTRLKPEMLYFKLKDKNIAELSSMDINALAGFMEDIESDLSERQNIIARDILKEIRSRLGFLLDVGLNYLSLNRSARSLSGGESQRIRLATQIGSRLVNVLYILDEPSIGLHQRDNRKLIASLQSLRDQGNSVIVVEHDRDMILSADYIVDLGPGAGRCGGELVAAGSPKQILAGTSLTAQYLNKTREIASS